MKTEEREAKVSFISKENYQCPICDTEFHREELLSGSGRLIAGDLTDELHRLYEPSARYGQVHPLIYAPTVCPECWFASMDRDFLGVPKDALSPILKDQHRRNSDTRLVFEGLDFHESRDLAGGAAAYYLVMRCYERYPKESSPTIKMGIASLRASWLLEEMEKDRPGEHYGWLATLFKKKACYFYSEALSREQSGKETLSGLKIFGPDTDKNYGYEGFLYLVGLLQLKYGSRENPEAWASSLGEAKRTIAKMFGLGKSSKNKPGPLLEHARRVYDEIGRMLHETDD